MSCFQVYCEKAEPICDEEIQEGNLGLLTSLTGQNSTVSTASNSAAVHAGSILGRDIKTCRLPILLDWLARLSTRVGGGGCYFPSASHVLCCQKKTC